MLVDGARLLARRAFEDEDGEEDLKNALSYLASARVDIKQLTENVKNLEAHIDLAEGIVKSALALKGMLMSLSSRLSSSRVTIEENEATRQDRFADSLQLIERSLATAPSASTHYHLSLALSRATASQNIEKAIEHAKLAIEMLPGEARSWHLLGLLLMISGEWAKAMKIIEEGIKVSERVFTRGMDGETANPAVGHANGSLTKTSPSAGAPVLEDSSDTLPPAKTLISPVPDPPVLTRRDEFEVALQLRLTYLAIIEHAHGSEKASNSWLELFTWFRDRKLWALDDSTSTYP